MANTKHTTMRLPKPLHEWAEKYGKKKLINVSGVVREALLEHKERHEKEVSIKK
jgi:Arc/MetJ-type ribon-helix-helix transcriptional regulator